MSTKSVGYTIGAVAEMYEVHPQTLRTYEREGLLRPSRSQGNRRLFSDDDLRRLETILSLTRDLGVNLAGVEVILNMREKMEAMQSEVESLVEYLCHQFDLDSEFFNDRVKTALIRVPPSQLVRIRERED
ncbi:MAG: helix-turn-helix transcriptional regulator [Acidobacteriota bacterium]